MEIILELVVGLVVEAALGVAGELLVEFGFHTVDKHLSDRTGRRVVTGVVYAIAACVLGALSLLILPVVVVQNRAISIAYFVVAPIVAGFALCVVNWIILHDIDRVRFFQPMKFLYGVIFVLAFSGTRAFFG